MTATNRAPRGNNHLGLNLFIFIELRIFIKEFAAKAVNFSIKKDEKFTEMIYH
jgi:hypothetical protein